MVYLENSSQLLRVCDLLDFFHLPLPLGIESCGNGVGRKGIGGEKRSATTRGDRTEFKSILDELGAEGE